MSLTCTQCAEPLAPGVRFCSACGTRVEEKRAVHSHYMTILFCDLAGSTQLTEQLGDEGMFDLITRYQKICNAAVADNGGYVAKYMGDGMLAYFGHPEPSKNSANAAVSAALRIVEQTKALSMQGVEVSSSAGTATGWMILGDTNIGAAAAETMAIGGTVNLAARLQSEAEKGGVAVSSETGRRLDQTQFNLTPLGARDLKGFSDPVQVWQVNASSGGRQVGTYVGRAPMRAELCDIWETVQGGQIASVVIQGPGGYGKTSMAESFIEESVSEGNVFVVRGQRHRRERSFAAFRPFILALASVSASAPREAQKATLAAWAPDAVLPGLLVLCDLNDELVSPILRGPMIESAILKVLQTRLPDTPAVLMLDDAHWLDADSLQLIGKIAETLSGRSLMVLATRRPEGADVPLENARVIELDQMDFDEMNMLISALDTNGTIKFEMRAQIIKRAAGVPLYVEHMTQAILERPDGKPKETIPTTMIEALLERFANLGDTRALVEATAVLGAEARIDVLAAMLQSDQSKVYDQIAKLMSRGLFRPAADGAVAFDHALIREALVDTLIASNIRHLHTAALAAYDEVSPELLRASPVTAAYHLMGADRVVDAMPKLVEAAQGTLAKGEIAEAVRLLNKAEENLHHVPSAGGLRDSIEMAVKFSLGLALVQHRGFSDPGVAESYGRALELCRSGQQGGETEFQIAWGIWAHYTVIGEVEGALGMSNRMDEIAKADPALEVLAAAARSTLLCNRGDLDGQEAAVAEVHKLYVPNLHRMHAVTYSMDSLELSLLFRTHGRYIAGDLPNWQATRAAVLEHETFLELPFLRPYIRIYGFASNSYAHTDEEYRPELAAATAFAAEIGQPFWIMAGQIWLAHEMVRNGEMTEATSALEAATDQSRAVGLHLGNAYHMATLARCFALTGRPQDALDAIKEALSENEVGRDLLYTPEVLRLQAEVTILNDPDALGPANSILDHAQSAAKQAGSRAWSALITGSRARLMATEVGQDKAQKWLEQELSSLVIPGSELHPAFVTARKAMTRPV